MDMMDLIKNRRSIRKFKQDPVSREDLLELAEAGRLAPQGANLQPIKYQVIDDAALLPQVFETTKWAGYLKGAGTPREGERPTAYILILADTDIKKNGYDTDAGAAAENVILAAAAKGLGTCWLGALDRKTLGELLGVPENCVIHSMLAIGYPAESPVYEDAEDSIVYYKDESGILHVPKRKLTDILRINVE